MSASLPPLNLTSGPAVSGGGSVTTPVSTGDFIYSPNARPTAVQGITSALPLVAVAVVALVLILNRS